ncbi:MAG TPA: pyridoxal-phosphate dependent enzyme, partial [Ktedonobacterales bacterium]
GGSVKDRIGVSLIEACERDGSLRPGGTIIEPTSGNTGTGLALAAVIKGYRITCVMTDKVSEEKRSLLRAYGAEVVICPSTVPFDSPEHYKNVAARLAKELPGGCMPNQYRNPANPEAHVRTTGPEIWEDTEGKVTAFVAGIGTAGTIVGTARYLKSQNPNVKVIGADPAGSIFSGDEPRPYKVEGIGTDHFESNWDPSVVDEIIRVDDKTSFALTRRLAREEGILCGGSAGTALAAALHYAKKLTEKDVVVVLLPDTGRGYLSKIYNDTWMRENGFLEPEHDLLSDVLALKAHAEGRVPEVVSVTSGDTVAEAIAVFQRYGISQLPVVDGGKVVGSLTEGAVLKRLANGESLEGSTVADWQAPAIPVMSESSRVREAYDMMVAGQPAVAVAGPDGALRGIVARADLMAFWANSERR